MWKAQIKAKLGRLTLNPADIRYHQEFSVQCEHYHKDTV